MVFTSSGTIQLCEIDFDPCFYRRMRTVVDEFLLRHVIPMYWLQANGHLCEGEICPADIPLDVTPLTNDDDDDDDYDDDPLSE